MSLYRSLGHEYHLFFSIIQSVIVGPTRGYNFLGLDVSVTQFTNFTTIAKVVDCDTVDISTTGDDGATERIRLVLVDAPKYLQPGGGLRQKIS